MLNGDADGEGAPLAEFAFESDAAAEQSCEFLDDRESQAGAAVFASHRILLAGCPAPLAELLEDRFLVVQRDAHSVVFDHEVDLSCVVSESMDPHAASFGGELDRV